MRVLFFFMDGVGLGVDDPAINPFARAEMPHLQALLGDHRLLEEAAPWEGERATLLALDARLGVSGLPQSATGQATLLTGVNVPAALGYHYGPKPNPAVAEFVRNGNLFNHLSKEGRRAAFLNAYPPRYFHGIESGRRLYSAIPLAATSAGLALRDTADLEAGRAVSADLTGQGWRQQLGLPETPLLTPEQAGSRLAELASGFDFALFEYWLTDYAGHHQDMAEAVRLLEGFDRTLGGLLESWNDGEGLILFTSDHGNLEDLSTRRHTMNPAPALLVGAPGLRREFASGLSDLAGIAPAIKRMLKDSSV
jgi:hypothetical protein